MVSSMLLALNHSLIYCLSTLVHESLGQSSLSVYLSVELAKHGVLGVWLQGSPHFTCKGMEFRELNRFALGCTVGESWGALSFSIETRANHQLSLASTSHACPMCLPTRPLPPAFSHFGFIPARLPDVPRNRGLEMEQLSWIIWCIQ